jgi:hypothetical protein
MTGFFVLVMCQSISGHALCQTGSRPLTFATIEQCRPYRERQRNAVSREFTISAHYRVECVYKNSGLEVVE